MKKLTLTLVIFLAALTCLTMLNAQTNIQLSRDNNLTKKVDTDTLKCLNKPNCSCRSILKDSSKGLDDPVGPGVVCYVIGGGRIVIPPEWTNRMLGQFCWPLEGPQVCDPVWTTPVELTAFSAIALTGQSVQLNWVTQTETGVLGFYVHRNTIDDASTSVTVSTLIPATNTSQETNYSYIDNEACEGLSYYWLENVDLSGNSVVHGPALVTVIGEGGGSETPEVIEHSGIKSIYPNPFNPSVTISYSLLQEGDVCIGVYNQKGAKIRSLECSTKHPGLYSTVWDGKDSNNNQCASGQYIVRMISGNNVEARKLVLSK